MPSSATVVAVVAVIIVVISVVVYFATNGGASPAPGPAPSALTPRQTLLATGQAIQKTEIEIGTTVVVMNPQPILPAVCTYSMSMDLRTAKSFSSWKCILNSVNAPDWEGNGPAPNTRRPTFGFTGENVSSSQSTPNQPFLNHTDAAGNFQGDLLWEGNGGARNTPIPLDTWVNYTFTIDSTSKKGILYVNGIKQSEFTAQNAFAWPSPSTTWTWNNDSYDKTVSVKVKNAYFFSRALTSGEIATLTGVSPGTTTSGYTPEPYSGKGVSGY